jgi:hypothetical protein
MADDNNSGSGGGGSCLFIIIIIIVLAAISPGVEELNSRLSSDGWIPVDVIRINLLICNLNFIKGITGMRGPYFGCFRNYYGFEWEPD